MKIEIQKTQQDITNEQIDLITKNSQKLEDFIIGRYKLIFDLVMFNQNATPQEIMDAFGSQAYKLFQESEGIQAFLAQNNPDYVALIPPYEYTINQDGTVTIGNVVEGYELVENSNGIMVARKINNIEE